MHFDIIVYFISCDTAIETFLKRLPSYFFFTLKKNFLKNFMVPFMDGIQLPRGYRHFDKTVYFTTQHSTPALNPTKNISSYF